MENHYESSLYKQSPSGLGKTCKNLGDILKMASISRAENESAQKQNPSHFMTPRDQNSKKTPFENMTVTCFNNNLNSGNLSIKTYQPLPTEVISCSKDINDIITQSNLLIRLLDDKPINALIKNEKTTNLIIEIFNNISNRFITCTHFYKKLGSEKNIKNLIED